jgi:hypothetical protein
MQENCGDLFVMKPGMAINFYMHDKIGMSQKFNLQRRKVL